MNGDPEFEAALWRRSVAAWVLVLLLFTVAGCIVVAG